MTKLILILCLMAPTYLMAETKSETLKKDNCSTLASMAAEIQFIRQSTSHDHNTFEFSVDFHYKTHPQSFRDLVKNVGRRVYNMPEKVPPKDIGIMYLTSCVGGNYY